MPALETIQKSNRICPVVSLLRAFVAALIAWGFIHTQHPVFEVPEKYHIHSMGAPPEKTEALRVQQARVDRMNATLDIAVLGGLLAGAMALGKSACCTTVGRLLIALPWGALVGSFAGFVAFVVHSRNTGSTLPTVSDTIQVQAVLFASLGAGLGLMVGAFARSARAAAGGTVAGAVAGALAGMAYPITAAILLASASTEPIIPAGTHLRLLWLGLFTACVAVIIPAVAHPEPPVARPDTPQES